MRSWTAISRAVLRWATSFGARGRKWLVDQESPADGHDTVKGCLRQVDFLNEEILHLDQPIAEEALGSPDILRLMTIPGVSVTNGGDLMAMGRRHRPLSQRRATWSATSVLI
jgi:hypothetical protein